MRLFGRFQGSLPHPPTSTEVRAAVVDRGNRQRTAREDLRNATFSRRNLAAPTHSPKPSRRTPKPDRPSFADPSIAEQSSVSPPQSAPHESSGIHERPTWRGPLPFRPGHAMQQDFDSSSSQGVAADMEALDRIFRRASRIN